MEKIRDKAIQKKIQDLLKAIVLNPYEGTGKPEALKHELSGQWSRCINKEHGIIYDISNNALNIYSLKGHY